MQISASFIQIISFQYIQVTLVFHLDSGKNDANIVGNGQAGTGDYLAAK